jgi:hypothetical protein
LAPTVNAAHEDPGYAVSERGRISSSIVEAFHSKR